MNAQSLEISRPRRLAAVWFADIVGFTRLSAEDEPLALLLVEVVQTAAQEAAEAHGGWVVKFMGDGVLAEFSSVQGAAAAAIQLQLHVARVTRDWARAPHRLRVGVHLGDVAVAADGDIYGDGVNRASRLQGLAEPGRILVSEDVYRQLRPRPDMYCTDAGFRTAKGIDEPIQVYRLEPGAGLARRLLSTARLGTGRARAPRGFAKPIAVGAAVGILSFMTLGAWTGMVEGSRIASESSMESIDAEPFSIALANKKSSLRDEHAATYSCPHSSPIGASARGGQRRGGDARTPDVRWSDSRRAAGCLGRDGRRRSPQERLGPKPRRVHKRYPSDHGAGVLGLSR